MKLTKLDTIRACAKGLPIVIKDASDIETDMVVHVVGVDSEAYRTANAVLNAKLDPMNKRIEQLTKRVESSGDDHELASNLARLLKEREALYCKMMAKCTTGFDNVEIGPEMEQDFADFGLDDGTDTDGLPTKFLRFSEAAALRLFERIPIIKAQVFVGIFERAKFLGNAATPSPSSSKARLG